MIQLPSVTTPQRDHVEVTAVLRRPGNRSSFRQVSSTYGQISSTFPRIIGHMHVTGHIVFAHTSQYACHQHRPPCTTTASGMAASEKTGRGQKKATPRKKATP